MPVASSTYTLDGHAQVDGRRYVRETHTLTVGAPVVVEYLAALVHRADQVSLERAAATVTR